MQVGIRDANRYRGFEGASLKSIPSSDQDPLHLLVCACVGIIDLPPTSLTKQVFLRHLSLLQFLFIYSKVKDYQNLR